MGTLLMLEAPKIATAQHWVARAVFGLDVWLRRWNDVFEYSSNLDCIFRLEIVQLQHPVILADGTTLDAALRIARLHLWTEHVPQMSAAGPTLCWARRMMRHIEISLQDLARFLSNRQDLDNVCAVQADMMFGTAEETQRLLYIGGHFGFIPAQEAVQPSLPGLLHRYGENILIAGMVLAQNPRAFRSDCFLRCRVSVYLPRSLLDRRCKITGRSLQG